jgi:hypothetical protein
MSMSTGRWSELSAEHDVRYTGDVKFLVINDDQGMGVEKGLYGLVVGMPGPTIKQEFLSA